MLVFPKEKQGFLKTALLEVNIDFGSILMPTWSHFAPQDRPKSSRKSIPRGIVFLIDFGIDFLSTLAPSWRARWPKDAPRGAILGPKMGRQNPIPLTMFASWPPRAPKTPPRPPQDAPKTPQDAPRSFQDASKTAQDAPKTRPRRPQDAP